MSKQLTIIIDLLKEIIITKKVKTDEEDLYSIYMNAKHALICLETLMSRKDGELNI